MEKTPKKAKRVLKDVTFTHEGAHVALVSKEQGGPANGCNFALVMKSNGFSQEAVQKMQQVQVTLDLPEFLRRFFEIYYDDSEVLARMMGYVPEKLEDEYDSESYYTKRLEAFTVMKSLQESGDLLTALALLNEDEYLSLLQAQVEVEKAFAALDAETKSDKSTKVDESENSTNASVEKSVEASGSQVKKSKKENMTLKTKGDEPVIEMVEKSTLEGIQKALDQKQIELEKALETVKAFETAQKEQLVKMKTEKVIAVVTDEKLQAAVVKAALSLESEEDFTAFLAAIQSMAVMVEKSKEAVEKSMLFTEQGVSTSTETTNQEGAVARILKSRLIKATK